MSIHPLVQRLLVWLPDYKQESFGTSSLVPSFSYQFDSKSGMEDEVIQLVVMMAGGW